MLCPTSRRSANGNEAVSLLFGIYFILIVIGVRNVSCSYGFCYKDLMLIVLVVIVYFLVLLLFSRLTAGKSDNETFFRANRRSPWYMVAFGMVGASISGISFVSVPGMSLQSGMTYLQMCLGFILGYFAIAFVLLPVYYRLHLTTITPICAIGWVEGPTRREPLSSFFPR